MKVQARLLPAALQLALVLVACASEDVLVFEAVPAVGGSGGADGDLTSSVGGSNAEATTVSVTSSTSSTGTSTTGASSEPCSDVYDCGYYFFCNKATCETEIGDCEPRPVFCEPNPSPVCGCDGVTYWNDCQRRLVGVFSSTPGECTSSSRRCNSGSDCGVFPASCARILPPGRTCGPELYPRPEGTCWSVPPRPADLVDNNLFLLCPGPNMDPPGYCADTHLAIASELPHLRINEKPECPNGENLADQPKPPAP